MKSEETLKEERLAEQRRKAMQSQIVHGVGPSDAPWPLAFAFIVFVLMLVPFMIHWSDATVAQQHHENRDRLMEQLMQRSNQQSRPRTYVRQ
jgi:hypothetical protein